MSYLYREKKSLTYRCFLRAVVPEMKSKHCETWSPFHERRDEASDDQHLCDFPLLFANSPEMSRWYLLIFLESRAKNQTETVSRRSTSEEKTNSLQARPFECVSRRKGLLGMPQVAVDAVMPVTKGRPSIPCGELAS